MKSIQSPDGVALLMENLWLRHKAGIQQTDGKGLTDVFNVLLFLFIGKVIEYV